MRAKSWMFICVGLRKRFRRAGSIYAAPRSCQVRGTCGVPATFIPGASDETRRTMASIEKTDEQWRAELTPEQYEVLRLKGTEAPFSGEYDHVFEPGSYHCAGCGAELFVSETKYDSGCGWPAFFAPTDDDAIEEESDTTYGMVRTEIMC